MNEPGDHPFLKEGLRRYPVAMATIELFQQTLQDHLVRLLDDYEHEHLQITSTAPRPGENNSRGSRRVFVYHEAISRDAKTLIWIELGLWWEGGKSALFASLLSETDKRVRLANIRKHDRVECQLFGSNKWRLFLPVSPEDDLEDRCKILLDELALAQ
jgi:hypothetical protein